GRQGFQFAVDAAGAGLGRLQLALLALQLAGQLGDAAVGQVEAALGVLAVLLGLEQAVAQAGEGVVELLFAPGQHVDLGAQALDLALAGQGALLRLAAADGAQPALPQPFAGTGDGSLALAQAERTGGRNVLDGAYARQQAAHGVRALHLRGQGTGRGLEATAGG